MPRRNNAPDVTVTRSFPTRDAWDAAVFAERQRLGYEHTRVRGYSNQCTQTCAACARERGELRHRRNPIDAGCAPDCPVCEAAARQAGEQLAERIQGVGQRVGQREGWVEWGREYLGNFAANPASVGPAAPAGPVRSRLEPAMQQIPRERTSRQGFNYRAVFDDGRPNPLDAMLDEAHQDSFNRRVRTYSNISALMPGTIAWSSSGSGVAWIGGSWEDFIKFWGQVGEVHEAKSYMKSVDESKYVPITKLSKDFKQNLGKAKSSRKREILEQLARNPELARNPVVYINEAQSGTQSFRAEPAEVWRISSVDRSTGVINMALNQAMGDI